MAEAVQERTTAVTPDVANNLCESLSRIAHALEQIANQGAGPSAIIESFEKAGEDRSSEVGEILSSRLSELTSRLDEGIKEIKQEIRTSGDNSAKDFYTVSEVEQRTPYKAYTIRQACKNKRIAAQKADDGTWRISHEVLVEIQNKGLPSPSSR